MKLRPHHILDIISDYGRDAVFAPHPYGHALHVVAQSIIATVDQEIELVIGADEICRPCMHLMADGHCDDMLRRFDPPLSKQAYNDGLDARILAYLNLPPSCVTTVRQYLHTVAAHLPGLETICTHPGEDRQARLRGLQNGLTKLGIGAS